MLREFLSLCLSFLFVCVSRSDLSCPGCLQSCSDCLSVVSSVCLSVILSVLLFVSYLVLSVCLAGFLPRLSHTVLSACHVFFLSSVLFCSFCCLVLSVCRSSFQQTAFAVKWSKVVHTASPLPTMHCEFTTLYKRVCSGKAVLNYLM